jgi:hypothetical protein
MDPGKVPGVRGESLRRKKPKKVAAPYGLNHCTAARTLAGSKTLERGTWWLSFSQRFMVKAARPGASSMDR